MAFLTDGRIPIDNLHVERRHRVVALGRNYLFCGSDEGARRHAIISTVLGNCALAGVNPFAYLRGVVAKLAGDWRRGHCDAIFVSRPTLSCRSNGVSATDNPHT